MHVACVCDVGPCLNIRSSYRIQPLEDSPTLAERWKKHHRETRKKWDKDNIVFNSPKLQTVSQTSSPNLMTSLSHNSLWYELKRISKCKRKVYFQSCKSESQMCIVDLHMYESETKNSFLFVPWHLNHTMISENTTHCFGVQSLSFDPKIVMAHPHRPNCHPNYTHVR